MAKRVILIFLCLASIHVVNAQLGKNTRKDTIFISADSTTKLEVEASVSRKLWTEHLSNSLQPAIDHAVRKGMKKGLYIVQVRFLVEKDGSISGAMALNDPGYGLAKAAENAVQTGPYWRPGKVNGRPVRSYHTQPISFAIVDK